MVSAQDYLQRVLDLGIEHLDIQADSEAEAREWLRKVRQLERELRQIKREINVDVKAIRTDYKVRIANAAATPSDIMSLFGKRKLAGQMRAAEKRRLSQERDNFISGYDHVKLIIDDVLAQLGGAKDEIQQYIQEQKQERQEQKTGGVQNRAEGRYCPQCGIGVGKTDRFCRGCGTPL